MLKVALWSASLLAAAAAGWFLRGELAIDACLDRGGRWERAGGFCVGAEG